LMVNGHGLAHPRRCGIASYLGVVLNMPSIGIARKLLYGELRREGGREYIVVDGRYVGIAIGGGRHTIYITIGNKVDIEDLEAIALKMMPKEGELPLPIYWADRISRQMSRGLRSLDSFLSPGRGSIKHYI
ncbi:MAG: endonuclease V, partial [Sulfolobales archaeon]